MDARSDRHEAAARSNYANGDNLRKRQALSNFIVDFTGTPPDTFFNVLPEAGRIVDVGCGNGIWAERVATPNRSVIGLDSSVGLAKEFRERGVGPAVWADAHRLPFATGSVDALLMLWMLYHVKDKETALAESARVLQADGVLVAATNTEETSGRHTALMSGAVEETLGRRISSWLPALDFHTANGAAILGAQFATVETHSWERSTSSLNLVRSSISWTVSEIRSKPRSAERFPGTRSLNGSTAPRRTRSRLPVPSGSLVAEACSSHETTSRPNLRAQAINQPKAGLRLGGE